MEHVTEPEEGARRLAALMRGRSVAVLTGAGISTDSGIPDYRGPTTRDKPRRSIQHQEFVADARARQRYWARATRGWPHISAARPNAGHRAVAKLEQAGRVKGLVTQNVDGLHQAAGSAAPIELHGALREVICLACQVVVSREDMHTRLLAANPGALDSGVVLAPDGDAELADAATARFVVPACDACGGVLKPHVVFFGGTVPGVVAQAAYAAMDAADALVVLGSSLTVFSGYRFVRRMAKAQRPIAIVTLGETRGDPQATLRIDAPLGVVLPALLEALDIS